MLPIASLRKIHGKAVDQGMNGMQSRSLTRKMTKYGSKERDVIDAELPPGRIELITFLSDAREAESVYFRCFDR